MADNPQKTARAERPLSPHLTIYRWPVTMMTSITHRVTGVGLGVGTAVLAWWLFSISNGPESYADFYAYAGSPLGLLVLFGLTWALCFHLLNGIRHLAWDLGYGFAKATANRVSVAVIGASVLLAIGIFLFVWTGHAGYLQ